MKPDEAQKPASSLAVATGSLPVSSAERLVKIWSRAAVDLNERANRLIETGDITARQYANQDRIKADIYDQCAVMLRWDLVAATVRQPAPNVEISHAEKKL